MLEQAEERSRRTSIYDLKQNRKKALIWTMTQVGLTVSSILNASTTDSKEMRVFASVLGGIAALTVVTNGLNYKLVVLKHQFFIDKILIFVKITIRVGVYYEVF